jgi:hypothetical protein
MNLAVPLIDVTILLNPAPAKGLKPAHEENLTSGASRPLMNGFIE